jgi:uncharacterized protein (TIGR02118 family)
MIKLIIFFRKPADVDAFEEFYARQYVPATAVMPHVKRSAVSRALGAPRGEPPYHLIQEFSYDTLSDLHQSLNSPEGRAAGSLLMSFAQDLVSIMYAEVWE